MTRTAPHARQTNASHRARRRGVSRTASMLLAVGVALAFAILVGVVWYRGPRSATNPNTAQAPPTLPSAPGGVASGGADLPGLGRGDEFFVQFVDRNDPTRLAGEITASRSTPLPERRYQLEEPRAWFFLRDGRSVHVQAASGTITLPQRGGQPDDGRLEGTVQIRVYAPRHDAKRPDVSIEKPVATVTTPRMSVDMVLGQLDVPDAISVQSERFEYAGSGVTAQFDSAQQRIEMVHVRKTDHLILRDGTRATAQTPPGEASTATSQELVASAAAPQAAAEVEAPPSTLDVAAPQEETLYTLTAAGPVRIEKGSSTLLGSEVRGWGRLIDNQLPLRTKQALDGRAPRERATAVAPSPPSTPVAEALPAATQAPATSTARTAQPEQPIIARWDGPLIVRRVTEASKELSRDDLFVRVLGDGATRALAVDLGEWKTTLEGQELEYAATRRAGAIAGGATNATILARGTGSATAPRIELDMLRNIVRFPAGGELVQELSTSAVAQSGPGSLRWTGAGEFQLDDQPLADASGLRLTHARVLGSVLAKGGSRSSLVSDELAIAFMPTPRAQGSPQPQELTAIGAVRVQGESDDTLASDTLRVLFETGTDGEARPRTVIARGNVRAAQGGDSLACTELEAQLANDSPAPAAGLQASSRNSDVTDVHATGDVRFTGRDGVTARAHRLTAQPRASTVRLLAGDPSMPLEVASIASSQGTIAGEDLRLSLEQRTMHVVGPGTLSTTAPAEGGQPARTIDAAWTGEATFDERAGSSTIRGGATVDARAADASAHDSLAAPTLLLTFDSQTQDSANHDPRTTSTALALRTVRATTDATSPTGVVFPVKVHVRRFAPADTSTPASLGFLECDDASMDLAAGTMRVAGAGKLLTSSRGEAASQPASTPDQSPLSSSGDALFTWKESLEYDRSGEVRLQGGVRLVRRGPASASSGSPSGASSELSELECARLVANFDPASKAGNDAVFGMGGTLRTVTASEGVWTRSAGKELTSDRLIYDVASNLIDADGASRLVVVASADGSPTVTARRVRWNVASGRVDVLDAGPVSGPR